MQIVSPDLCQKTTF